jgi:hypothetical protein
MSLKCVHDYCKAEATRVPLNYGNHGPVALGGWDGVAWCDKHAPRDSQPDPGPNSGTLVEDRRDANRRQRR